jgi:hypothetical protein
MLNERGGRSSPTRTRRLASKWRDTTRSDNTVTNSPDSTAERTASLEGSSMATFSAAGSIPFVRKALSKMERVPDPGSRRIQRALLMSLGRIRRPCAQGCSGATTATSRSSATVRVERRSGLGQMLSFRHSDEDAQLLESHGDRSIGSNGTYDISQWNAQSGVSMSRCIEDIERKGESRW